MNNYTKLLTALVLIFSCSTLQSQDVGVVSYTNLVDAQMVFPGDTIDVELTATNYGSTTVAMSDYDSLPISLYANGKLIAQHPFGGQDWLAAQTYIVLLFTRGGFETWGDYNIDSGVVSLCAKTFIWKNGVNIDTDQSNDELCLPTVIYVGPPGTGQKELKSNYHIIKNVFFNQGNLNILFSDQYNGGFQCTITDVSGRIIWNNDLQILGQKSHKIYLPDLNSGIYITQLISDSGDAKSFKFSVE